MTKCLSTTIMINAKNYQHWLWENKNGIPTLNAHTAYVILCEIILVGPVNQCISTTVMLNSYINCYRYSLFIAEWLWFISTIIDS